MALCPECGGHLGPARLFRLRPRDPIQCPWCRSRLMIRAWVRWLRDGLLVVGGVLAVTWGAIRYLDSGSDLYIYWGLGAWILLLAVAGIVETAAPLETRVPRDFRDWQRERPAESGHDVVSVDEPSSPTKSSFEAAERR